MGPFCFRNSKQRGTTSFSHVFRSCRQLVCPCEPLWQAFSAFVRAVVLGLAAPCPLLLLFSLSARLCRGLCAGFGHAFVRSCLSPGLCIRAWPRAIFRMSLIKNGWRFVWSLPVHVHFWPGFLYGACFFFQSTLLLHSHRPHRCRTVDAGTLVTAVILQEIMLGAANTQCCCFMPTIIIFFGIHLDRALQTQLI